MLHAAGVLILVFMGVLVASAIWHRGASLHWARFFFRGWVVLSLVWVGMIGAVGWQSIVAPFVTNSGAPVSDANYFDRFDGPGDPPASIAIEGAEHVAVIAIIPPLGLLALGLACAWALRGLGRVHE